MSHLENKNAPVAELEQAIGLDPMSSEGSNPSWGIYIGTVAQWQSVRLISEEILVRIHSVLLRQGSLVARHSPDKRGTEVRFLPLLLKDSRMREEIANGMFSENSNVFVSSLFYAVVV